MRHFPRFLLNDVIVPGGHRQPCDVATPGGGHNDDVGAGADGTVGDGNIGV
jgi:hypothetical protein